MAAADQFLLLFSRVLGCVRRGRGQCGGETTKYVVLGWRCAKGVLGQGVRSCPAGRRVVGMYCFCFPFLLWGGVAGPSVKAISSLYLHRREISSSSGRKNCAHSALECRSRELSRRSSSRARMRGATQTCRERTRLAASAREPVQSWTERKMDVSRDGKYRNSPRRAVTGRLSTHRPRLNTVWGMAGQSPPKETLNTSTVTAGGRGGTLM